MSSPKVLVDLIIAGTRIFGKAMAEAGRQAARNATYKPEGSSASSSASGSGGKASADMMSVEEARLVLNVKKDDPFEVIQKNYETIFAANSPPPITPKDPKSVTPENSTAASRKTKQAITHSHYLQSKVYRALERLKAERGIVESEGLERASGEAGSGEGAVGAAGDKGTPGEDPSVRSEKDAASR